MPILMKLLYDFFPAILFYIAYKFYGIFVATGVLIVASAVQVGYLWIRHRRVETMHVITFILVLIFGGTTIILHDAIFLKWKVSIINWLFGLAFLASEIFMKKTLVQWLIEEGNKHHKSAQKQFDLPKNVWRKLNAMWAGYFLLIGFVNIYIVYQYSTRIWVDFKVFGMLGMTIVFILLQTWYLYKHLKKHHGH